MKSIKTKRVLLLLAALLFIYCVQAQMKISVPVIDNNFNDTKYVTYTPPSLEMNRKKLVELLNKSLSNEISGYTANTEQPELNLRFWDNQFGSKKSDIFFYEDFISLHKNSIIISVIKDVNNKFIVRIPQCENTLIFKNPEYAKKFAENFYYTLLSYDNEHLKTQQRIDSLLKDNEVKMKADSIQFIPLANNYRELKEKPVVTEEQRKYIVQANAFNNDKAYEQAIVSYQKANAVNPVAYPTAYYNMGLLYAEIKNYRLAIMNMKKYLLLVPDAPDARVAQDKIYEWER